jgi:hypothetical protein
MRSERHFKPKCLGGLEVYAQLDLGGESMPGGRRISRE